MSLVLGIKLIAENTDYLNLLQTYLINILKYPPPWLEGPPTHESPYPLRIIIKIDVLPLSWKWGAN